ncbi:putative ATP:guanido phosphotransferase [Oxobacter pfennigii]|uniref:Protein-arginine kinase n=1 Tax=Oxobacter pfennigii TaxID=36849 RepID=A0A0N8NSQ2_9CLOT|nr:protein arginine kinase [Oxobacter pfennigii]KPU42664.1 putative ATP:guanido phosphotransferase [Oxobacter pfennigii]
MGNWIESKGPDSNIVLSSRIRLARNISGYHFPHVMNDEESKKIIKKLSTFMLKENRMPAGNFQLIEMADISHIERMSLVEKHVISPRLAENYKNSAVIVNDDSTVSIMINEEDHIRLQTINPGLQLWEAYKLADNIDDTIEERLDYAFDQRAGYLTVCPTNIGTGIRASVMIHLPALSMTKNLNEILNAITQVGLTIRGIYGEGSNTQGNLYQISNQITLGLSEEEIISNLAAVTGQIINMERIERAKLLQSGRARMEDSIWRALGILQNARVLSNNESLGLMSNVRLGIELGIIKDIDITTLNKLMINTQPATLIKLEGKDLDTESRDVKRAKYVRENLK